VLRHWQPVFRASVLGPPVEVVVSKKFTIGQLLEEHLKPAKRLLLASHTAQASDVTEQAGSGDPENDADYEIAKWSEYFGNLNGSARSKTIRKLKFAGAATCVRERYCVRQLIGCG